MMSVDSLVDLLVPQPIADHRWQAKSFGPPERQLFGGQALAQGLAAAQVGVPGDQAPVVLHAQFLRAGNTSHDIDLAVTAVAESRTMTWRRVLASQLGVPLLALDVSFAALAEGLEHQDEIPDVRPADSLPDSGLRYPAPGVPEGTLEFRYVPDESQTRSRTWIRACGTVIPGSPAHDLLLVFATDLYLCDVMLRRHGRTPRSPDVWWGTLDHTVHWHRPVRADRWFLLDSASPSAASGRGYLTAHVYGEDGALVASIVQQTLARTRRREQAVNETHGGSDGLS